MKRKCRILLLLLAISLLFSGCMLGTVDELYCLPKRAGDYENLQAVIDNAMEDLEYCAPLYGDNRQVVQTADLDGDGVDEYLLFASDNSDKPLKILIFSQLASGYVLMDAIEGYGFGFDFVTYAQLDDKPGLEIVVGRQVSDQVVRSVCVYRFGSGLVRQLLSTSYSQALPTDLDGDGICELFVLMPGVSPNSNGTAKLYSYADGELRRSEEFPLSGSMDNFKQISAGILQDGPSVVYVTCAAGSSNLGTDIFAMVNGSFGLMKSAIQTETLHNYYVYPEDVDDDGVLEMPRLVQLPPVLEDKRPEYMIEWYSITSDGSEVNKRHTYHNFDDNWYLVLEENIAQHLSVLQGEMDTTFYFDGEKIASITVLTDADKDELATLPGRTILYSSDAAIYVAEFTSFAHNMQLAENIIRNFKPIRVELNTEKD